MSDLVRLEAAAAGLDSLPSEGEEADYVGRLDKIIRTLQGHRKYIMDELPGPVSGSEYRIVEERRGERSYNTAGLLAAFSDAGLDLPYLVHSKVVEPKWRWTELQRAMYSANVEKRIAPHEIDTDDLDAPLIGETWKSFYRVEGVK